MTTQSLMEFPCNFTIKIIGTHSEIFLNEILQIIKTHFPEFDPSTLVSKSSKESNYLALSATVTALNQKMLDSLYQDLTKHPDVKMVL